MTKRPKTSRRTDVESIASLLKKLDGILAGDQREMIYRLRTLAAEIDQLVPYYDGHMVRVTFYSVAIGLRMRLPQEDLLTLEIAALLHDFGKVGVECDTLDKEESLSDDESAEVRHHAERGYHIVSGFNKLERVAGIIRDHHERFDGNGYPNRKQGHDISLLSRIIAVADAYDAMTTSRPYRKGMTHVQAVAELVRHSGKQFDPEVVEHFISQKDVAALAARAADMFSRGQPPSDPGRRKAG